MCGRSNSVRHKRFPSARAARDLSKSAVDVDSARVVALVVTTPSNEGQTLIGGGRFVAEGSDSWEIAQLAFLVQDAYHGRGIEASC